MVKSILLIMSRYPGFGGIETVTTILANRWIEQYKVAICSITQQAEDRLLDKLDSRVKFYRMPYCGLKKSQKNLSFLEQIIQHEDIDTAIYQDSYYPSQYLIQYMNECKFLKIIQVEHNSPSGFAIQYHEYLKSVPIFDLYHRFKSWFYFQKSLRNERKNRRLLYNACDKYVMLAKSLIPQCQKYGHFGDEQKFAVIGNPISVDNSHVNLALKRKECLFVGRLDSMKGIDHLVKIWEIIEKQRNDWTLVIVGDGEKMTILEEALRRGQLKNVRVEGFQTDVERYYQTASVFCMCSLFEGFPMVLPEAMGFGVVPIAFDSFAALDDIITDGVDGIKVKSFDEKAYCQGLLSLLSDSDLLGKMQKKALENSKKFSVDAVLEKWNQLFKELEHHDR